MSQSQNEVRFGATGYRLVTCGKLFLTCFLLKYSIRYCLEGVFNLLDEETSSKVRGISAEK